MPRTMGDMPRATVREMLSLTAQVFSELDESDVAALCEACDGHAGMTDFLADVVLGVVESLDQRPGGLSEYWNAVSLHTGGVPLYEVAQEIAHAMTAAETIDTTAVTQAALTACLELALTTTISED